MNASDQEETPQGAATDAPPEALQQITPPAQPPARRPRRRAEPLAAVPGDDEVNAPVTESAPDVVLSGGVGPSERSADADVRVAPGSVVAEQVRRARPADETIRFEDVISGQFDAQEAIEEVVVTKRVLAPMAETPKLHKVLAQAGIGSRLEMEQLIVEGRITVNNEPAHIGQRVQFGDNVKVNGKPIRFRVDPPPARVIAYHKPAGEVVTHDDPQNRPTVFRRLPKLYQGKWQSVGRLDLNTEGLLLFTNAGELANNLMHPRFGLEREYAVRVLGALSNEEKQRLLDGVRLDDGEAQFGAIEDGGGEGANCWYRVTISEGRNREVRRMFEAVGHAVSRLIRIRYGAMLLPRGLKRGAWMELDDRDIQALIRAASRGAGPSPEQRDKPRGGARESGDGAGASRQRRRGGPRANLQGRPDAPRDPMRTAAPADGGAGPVAGRNRSRATPEDEGERADRLAEKAQPDPMKTAFGYIGADSFTRQRQAPGQRRGPQRGGQGGGPSGSGGNTGGGNRRRGGRGR